jgi:hypothetical protein
MLDTVVSTPSDQRCCSGSGLPRAASSKSPAAGGGRCRLTNSRQAALDGGCSIMPVSVSITAVDFSDAAFAASCNVLSDVAARCRRYAFRCCAIDGGRGSAGPSPAPADAADAERSPSSAVRFGTDCRGGGGSMEQRLKNPSRFRERPLRCLPARRTEWLRVGCRHPVRLKRIYLWVFLRTAGDGVGRRCRGRTAAPTAWDGRDGAGKPHGPSAFGRGPARGYKYPPEELLAILLFQLHSPLALSR